MPKHAPTTKASSQVSSLNQVAVHSSQDQVTVQSFQDQLAIHSLPDQLVIQYNQYIFDYQQMIINSTLDYINLCLGI
jgi:hypothetical protein